MAVQLRAWSSSTVTLVLVVLQPVPDQLTSWYPSASSAVSVTDVPAS